MRKLLFLGGVTAIVALLTASTTLGALVNGSLPTAAFTWTSVTDNSVDIAGSGITRADLATLEKYISALSAVANPTAAQQTGLATYQARLTDYQARFAAAIDLRAGSSANVKTTYSRVVPTATAVAGFHFHNGPTLVSVTVGTLTFYDGTCATWDVSAGHSYIGSPRQVVSTYALPAKNVGVENVEFFTTRLYPAGAIDPVPVSPAPCTLADG